VVAYKGQGWARVAFGFPASAAAVDGGAGNADEAEGAGGSVGRSRWRAWCVSELQAGRTLLVRLWARNGSEAATADEASAAAAAAADDDDDEADDDDDYASNAAERDARGADGQDWAWQQVLEVPAATTVAELKAALAATNRLPRRLPAAGAAGLSGAAVDDLARRVLVTYAGRPLVACRVPPEGGAAAGEGGAVEAAAGLGGDSGGDSSALEATVRCSWADLLARL
jgi:hypothetical protein